MTIDGSAADDMTDVTSSEPMAKLSSAEEVRYLQGDAPPVCASVLMSTSKYLNNPYYRDLWCQYGLHRIGLDLPTTYLIPTLVRALADVTDWDEYAPPSKRRKRSSQSSRNG